MFLSNCLVLFIELFLFQCVAILTLVDNIMESLIPCLERNSINKTFINVVVTFLVVGVINALGVPHTTNVSVTFIVISLDFFNFHSFVIHKISSCQVMALI